MSSYVLLTRSEMENIRLANILGEYGINSISAPQIIYQQNLSKLQNIALQNIIITSKYAARIVAGNIHQNINCYVVGAESAKILYANSAIDIKGIYSNVTELHNDIQAKLQFTDTLYLSGDYITQELPYKRIIIYNTIYSSSFDDKVYSLIKAEKITKILVYSQQTARSIKQALINKNLLPYLTNIKIIALSEKIALEFIDLGCKILYCNKPCESEMINLVKS